MYDIQVIFITFFRASPTRLCKTLDSLNLVNMSQNSSPITSYLKPIFFLQWLPTLVLFFLTVSSHPFLLLLSLSSSFLDTALPSRFALANSNVWLPRKLAVDEIDFGFGFCMRLGVRALILRMPSNCPRSFLRKITSSISIQRNPNSTFFARSRSCRSK
jgi:hypothetical protein